LSGIEKQLNNLEAKDRLELLVKLLPYALPRYENVNFEAKDGNIFKKIIETLIQKGYGKPSPTDQTD